MYRFASLAALAGAVSATGSAVSAAPAIQLAQAQTRSAAPPARAPQPVTKADFTKRLDAQFGALDTNKDGSVDKAEVAAAQSRALQQATQRQQQRLEAEFKKLDTNKDNQLSLAEFKAATGGVRAGQTPDQMLSQLDSNKDGRVSAAEFRAPQLANFDKADTNKDGTITPAEVQAARQR